jgi:hypothetical protein
MELGIASFALMLQDPVVVVILVVIIVVLVEELLPTHLACDEPL